MCWSSAATSRTCGNSRRIIRNTLITGTLIALVLGIGGGLLTSRNFLRRVDAITDASRSIMQGDLSGRMPVKGTGDELDRLAQSLNQMLDQIERLMRGMQEVSSNVAHDLRTPLTRIKARAELALRSGARGRLQGGARADDRGIRPPVADFQRAAVDRQGRIGPVARGSAAGRCRGHPQ